LLCGNATEASPLQSEKSRRTPIQWSTQSNVNLGLTVCRAVAYTSDRRPNDSFWYAIRSVLQLKRPSSCDSANFNGLKQQQRIIDTPRPIPQTGTVAKREHVNDAKLLQTKHNISWTYAY